MAKKIKVLWASDINSATGFGTVSYALIPRLQDTGKYEFVGMGINYRGVRFPGMHIYQCDSQDVYGFNLFPAVARREKPDLVFALQDLFVTFKWFEALREVAPETPTVLYFPIDGNSTPPHWLNCVRQATVPVAYSEYGRQLVEERAPDQKGRIELIYHGAETDLFKPLSEANRDHIRSLNNVSDRFVVGVINRFQPRKLVPLAIRAFSLMYNGYKKCHKCGNYYLASLGKCDLNFCEGGEHDEIVPPKPEMFLYLHCNIEEHMMGGPANSLAMSWETAGIKKADGCIMTPGVDIYGPQTPPKEEMPNIYGMLDCYLAVDCGEGYGLTQMEALSCGIPVVKSSSTTGPELVGKFGHMVKSSAFFSMPYDSGHFRPVVAVHDVVDQLEEVYAEWLANGRKTKLSQEQHKHVVKNFNWDNIAKQFDNVFQKALEAPVNNRRSIQMARV